MAAPTTKKRVAEVRALVVNADHRPDRFKRRNTNQPSIMEYTQATPPASVAVKAPVTVPTSKTLPFSSMPALDGWQPSLEIVGVLRNAGSGNGGSFSRGRTPVNGNFSVV